MLRNTPLALAALMACNRPPPAPVVTLQPDKPTTADDLVATWTHEADPDGDAVAWEVRWLADGEERAQGVGDAFGTLSAEETERGETWTVEVVATDGHVRSEPASASVYIVNAPPELAITLGPDAPTTVDTLTAAATASDLEHDPVTITWTWQRDGAATAFDGPEVPPEATERGQRWTVTAVARDRDTASAPATAEVVIANAPPVLRELVVDPASPDPLGTLHATVRVDDPDDDVVHLAWTWTLDGAVVGDASELDLASAGASRGSVVQVAVTATDDQGASTTLTSAPLTASNTPPTLIADPVVAPSSPRVTDVLTCTGSASDADGDPVTLRWSWSRNGLLWSEDAAIPAAGFDRGDEIACTITPNDGTTDGPARAAAVTIVNSPPVARARVEPAAPGTEDTLVATPVLRSDADGDDVSLRFAWYVDGARVAEGPTLDPSYTARGASVALEVTPNDGIDDGATTRTDPTPVGDTPPRVLTLHVTPEEPRATDTLRADVTSFDPDGDEVSLRFAWWVDDQLVSTDPELPPGSARRGQTIVLEVTPSAAGADGATFASDPLRALNSPPQADSVQLTPEALREETVAACVPVGAVDPDGDPVGGVIQWSVDGVVVAEGPTLDGASFDKGQEVACAYLPADGLEAGAPVTSAPRRVENTPPTLGSATILPAAPHKGDTLSAPPTLLRDPDPADFGRLSVHTRWEVDGVEASASPTLSDAHFARGQQVVAVVTPSDGVEQGKAVRTAPVGVVNAPPVVQRITLGPQPAYTDTPAYATVEADDADGDALTIRVGWLVDSTDLGFTDGTLSPDLFRKGQALLGQAVAYDGIDSSAPLWSGLLTVINSPPRAPGVAISPPWPVAGQDPLQCTITQPSYDPDADTVTYTVAWTVDGAPYPRVGDRGPRSTRWLGDTVDVTDVHPGERWVCTATPYDVTDTGTPGSDERVSFLPDLRGLASGDGHSCAIALDGAVRCWGRNTHGAASPPVLSASRLAVGYDETCALDNRSFARCWGGNPAVSQAPLALYTDLSFQFFHACAVRTDRTVACWGANESGQIDAPPDTTFVQVTAGVAHSCARKLDGSIVCWGDDAHGQGAVPAGGPWTDVAAAETYTCAIGPAGAVSCWGELDQPPPPGPFRKLYTGPQLTCGIRLDDTAACWGQSAAAAPHEPPPGAWVSLAVGSAHVCGLRTDGAIECWGDTTWGQGISPTDRFDVVEPGDAGVCAITPDASLRCWGDPASALLAPPEGLADLVDLSVGGDRACAIDTSGGLTCWGAGHEDAIPLALRVSVAPALACAIDPDNELACWGDDSEGQAEPPVGTAWIDVAAGDEHACALDAFGVVACWGLDDDGRLDAPQGERFVDVDVGGATSCAVTIDGRLLCWGATLPGTPMPTGGAYARVTVGDEHACATEVNGEVACWGLAGPDRLAAPDVSLLDVRAAADQTCGVSWDGEARCWGAWVH